MTGSRKALHRIGHKSDIFLPFPILSSVALYLKIQAIKKAPFGAFFKIEILAFDHDGIDTTILQGLLGNNGGFG